MRRIHKHDTTFNIVQIIRYSMDITLYASHKPAIAHHLLTIVVMGCIMVGCGTDKGSNKTSDTASTARGALKADSGTVTSETTDAKNEEGGKESNEVAITPAMMKESGVIVAKVMEGPVSKTISATGHVIPTQSGMAHVGTVIPGRITRLFVAEGSHVGRGTALAEVESFGISELKSAYLRASADVERNRRALERSTTLSGEGIGATRLVEEARAAYRQGIAAQTEAATKLRALGINPTSLHRLDEKASSFSSRVVIRSPISGVVAKRSVALGEFVEPSTDVFEVVNTRTVWVDAQVQPSVAPEMRVGGVGFVHDPKGERRSGRIIFVSPSVDPTSRTVTIRIELSNTDNAFRPETFVTVEFETSLAGSALTIPADALEQDGEKFYVYREHEPNRFQRVEVEAGPHSETRVVIRSGLKKDDRIAASGVFYLKSIRQKGDLSESD